MEDYLPSSARRPPKTDHKFRNTASSGRERASSLVGLEACGIPVVVADMIGLITRARLGCGRSSAGARGRDGSGTNGTDGSDALSRNAASKVRRSGHDRGWSIPSPVVALVHCRDARRAAGEEERCGDSGQDEPGEAFMKLLIAG